MCSIDITNEFLLKQDIGSGLIDVSNIKLLQNLENQYSKYPHKQDVLTIDIPSNVISQFKKCYVTCSYRFQNGANREYGYLTLSYNPDTNTYQGDILGAPVGNKLKELDHLTFSFMGSKELKEGRYKLDTHYKVLTYFP
jgi:hypothetical protein